MNKQEAARQLHQTNALISLGFTQNEADKLRRISMTLRRWHELECGIDGGCVERDETTGKAMWRSSYSGKLSPIQDRETGARKRLAAIIQARNIRTETGSGTRFTANFLSSYIQTDPRGAALYIIRPGDIPEGQTVDSCYSRGICVY
jgi:hypothetical protein